jgi:hypothetical protein
MLTKKFTDFSADLLDAVRGVLGEAKKCKECGCAKCECEDEGKEDDDMEEGYVPTSDEPTEANKKTADKVRALLAKEKKPVKEEIDDALEAELKAQRQTKKSVADAKKKYGVKEEAEQIDELSDALLKNYSKKALAQSKTATGDQKLKRQVGARNAIDRLGNNTLAKEEVDLEEGENKTGLPKSTAEKNKQYIEVTHLLGHKKKVPVHPTNAYKALNRYRNDPSTKSARIVSEDAEQIDELSTKTLDSYRSKARKDIIDADANDDTDTYNKRTKGYTKASKNIRKNFVKGVDESFEQLDELSKATMGRYINKAATKIGTQGITAGLKIASDENSKKNFKDMGKREKGIARAVNKLTKEEQDFIDSLNADTLDEARGRPKKAGGKDFTIHPKTKEKLMHNNPEHMKKIELLQKNKVLEKPKTEAGQHIINQLQKAKTSMQGGSTIHFTHGDSKHVSGAHAAKLLDKYAGMKPNEKEDFQKKIGHSHEQLMKHV